MDGKKMPPSNIGARLKKFTNKPAIRLYLDDERVCPKGWLHVKTADEAISVLNAENVSEISLDHDLGMSKTGYDVLLWIEEAQHDGKDIPDVIRIHTANSSARIKMELAVKQINKRRDSDSTIGGFIHEKNKRRNSN